MTRVCIYTRQSVERDDGDKSLSIESQIQTLRVRCQTEGWTIVGEEREAGLRGWMDESERPALARCIERAIAGDYDTLLVWDMSRLARSVRLQEEWVYRLARAGVDIVSHTEPHAQDEMIRVIFGAIHQRQTKILSTTMSRIFAERSRRGLPHGRAPYGYRRDDAGRLVPDTVCQRADIVCQTFKHFVAGMGTTELAAWLTERGIPTHSGRRRWAATTVRTILENPAYRGIVDVGGVRIEAAHPPLIDPLTWQRAQERLADYTWTRRKDGPRSWLEGHIEHACGQRMYYQTKPTRESTNPAFICAASRHGRCPARPGRCAVAHAEDAAWALIVRALADVQPPERVVRRLRREEARLAPRVRSDRDQLLEQRRELDGERLLAEDLYLRGRRDRAWFDATDDRIAASLATVRARLADLPVAVDASTIADRHAALSEIAGSLDLALPADRGAIIAALGTVVVQPGTNRRPPVMVAWREPWRPFIGRQFAVADGSRA